MREDIERGNRVKKMKKYLPKISRTISRKLVARYKRTSVVNELKCRISGFRKEKKIIYALTPTPHLSNIGDHAQVFAIERWLSQHFPDHAVFEIDKNEVVYGQQLLTEFIKPDDLIFLHSGGNLGDRGLWSETGRRLMIQGFLETRIISLPQTIFFSDSDEGKKQQRISEEVYASHPNLTVIGRDTVSGQIAERLFPAAQVFIAPDFVLSLKLEDIGISDITVKKEGILGCLRVDNESTLSAVERQNIAKRLGRETTLTDTTLNRPINARDRVAVIRKYVEMVLAHEAVVTDRFHGLIFSIIAGRPTVVLPTIDHKLTSAIEWFDTTNFVSFARSVEQIDENIEKVLSQELLECPDFRSEYFDSLPKKLGLS